MFIIYGLVGFPTSNLLFPLFLLSKVTLWFSNFVLYLFFHIHVCLNLAVLTSHCYFSLLTFSLFPIFHL